METFDIVVIGGGLIGCAVACELAGEKLRVLVLDRQEPGREASWAAAGMLSPAPESASDFPLAPLARASLALYPAFVRGVEEDSGMPTGYAQQGTLQVFLGRAAEEQRDAMIAQHKKLGLCAEAVSLETARIAKALLGSSVCAAANLPDEATLEPRLLMRAVLETAARRGVIVRANCAATSLLYERDRCAGVCTPERIAAKTVVLAAGCFSAEFSRNGNGLPLAPTRPVRGQLLALRPQNFRLNQVVRSEHGYLVPRADGRIIAGSTIEDAGFEKRVTADGVAQILHAALEICPTLKGAELIETWSGLRPGTPDALPILGPAGAEGLVVATGHYRNGILLAPITAKLVREWITAGKTEFDASSFLPQRFSEGAARRLREPVNTAGR